ncbi:MAG TPA: hypothetical protein VHG51_14835, partial [Longimicrobiaceae bacterium]|nr:hypothetical protein [Longimicrobiaceae bacterium]
MPSDHARESGWLLGVLAQGARPWAYRARVHRLLGIPPREEGRAAFRPPLPPAGFRYLGRGPADAPPRPSAAQETPRPPAA